MFRIPCPGIWALTAAFTALAASIMYAAVTTTGVLTGIAVLAGAAAYAMMATNLLLAIRRPILEKLFGPLDRVYVAHRIIGTAILGAIGLHLALIPIASAVDRGQSLLDNLDVALPLGVVGALILVASIGLALNQKVAYDRWQKVHMATGFAFLVLTAHMLTGVQLWFSLASPYGLLLGGFALLGVASLAVRVADKARGGVPYVVAETVPRERGLEVVLRPEGQRRLPAHRPGQFAFLTAAADGAREIHPFTLTSARGEERVSVLIRASGDWTAKAQNALAVGDRVRLDGPFGAFTPAIDHEGPQQIWVAGGAGVTPFLSVLRTAERGGAAGRVELIVAARDADDAPCWKELSALAETLPWLRLTPAFSSNGGRLDTAAVQDLVAPAPADCEWYLCGPDGLTAMVERGLESAQVPNSRVHRERYQWRAGRPRR